MATTTFYDRPPGLLYCLTSPLGVHLNVGDAEPLVCTLTLYSLGNPCPGQVYGKLSEDYTFPAGDWENKIDFDAARRDDGELDPDMIEDWRRRKHKALFAYDPLHLSGGDASLHLVLQVHRVSAPINFDSSSTDTHSVEETGKTGQPIKKSIGRRIKNKLGKLSGVKGVAGGDLSSEAEIATASTEEAFGKFGTQLLTPLSFGVIPFCPSRMYTGNVKSDGMQNDKMKWPNGSKQLMHLYGVPSVPEDQGRFLERITAMALEERQKIPGNVPDVSSDPSGEFEDTEPARKGIFNKIRPSARAKLVDSEPLRVTGRAFVFASFLGSDFTQAMMTDPAAFGSEEPKDSSLPRLLVDFSGDCAIAVNPSSVDGISAVDGRKRSDLIRLPKTPVPSGYLGASEVREMMFLPPRFDKQYDVDPPLSTRSIHNVLFIYPRVLKFPSKDVGKGRHKTDVKSRYAVRVRLVRFASMNEDEDLEPMKSLYNPVPWAGPPILDDVFSKVTPKITDKSIPSRDGVVFRDEIKMRLPMIVDGTFQLQFSLVEVDVEDGDVTVQIIAKTSVPLSSSSTREASSGVRVTTIIPNGSHRLKLGDCQLQFETRLLSSLHVADPTAATALRDFPLNLDRNDAFRTLSLVPSRSVLGKSKTAEPIVDLTIPFYQLFATASDSDLLGSFHLFLFVHLCNLVNHDRKEIFVSTFLSGDDSRDDNAKFLMDNLQSMFELLKKVKLSLASRSDADTAVQRIEYFVKDVIDGFDENLFTSSYKDETVSIADRYADGSRGPTMIPLARTRSDQTANEKSGAARGDFVEDELESRETDGDRWKAEAEHYQTGARFSHLVDDDETVVTSFTYAGKDSKAEGPPSILASATWGGIDDDIGSVIDIPAVVKRETQDPLELNSFSDSNIAKRVRMAAQTIIAPCIAPSVSVMNDANSPQNKPYDLPKIGFNSDKKKRKTVFTQEFTSGPIRGTIVLQGVR
ncbi:hypothetical protein MHU86_6024 [Fragilaria crotonensis]|nr:hypothetical protein MHU86_6024 [Fragilaria crotonensis]